MSIRLLVCDDSGFARKQLIRALPPDWNFQITQAAHGLEGLDAIRKGLGDVVLLDLTMPEMDGYGVLAAIRDEGLKARVVVISGDVQEKAVARVKELGALAFLQKPVDPLDLRKTLREHGLFKPAVEAKDSIAQKVPAASSTAPPVIDAVIESSSLAPNQAQLEALQSLSKIGLRETFREVTNVAMGRAGALLARVLNVFVKLPIPNVNIFDVGDLSMALADAQRGNRVSAVCQGYIGGGISGEALLIFHDSNFGDVAKLMNYKGILDDKTQVELIMDLASLLTGACLNGFAEQLDVRFSQGHPVILGQHCQFEDLLRINQTRWKKTLAVEISYTIENHNVSFDLLFLFTEDSVPRLQDKLQYLME